MTVGKVVTGIEATRSKIRASALHVIDRVLHRPLVTNLKRRNNLLLPPKISDFKGLDPTMLLVQESGLSSDWFVFPDVTPKVLWPIDSAHIGYNRAGRICIRRGVSVPAKAFRGIATRFSPYMMRLDQGQEFDEGKLETMSAVFAWLGGDWAIATLEKGWTGDVMASAPEMKGELTEQDRNQAMLVMGVALRHRYEWSVSLGYAGTPSVRFATDPTGIKEVFKFREVADGAARRDALMTWVADHWRADRIDPDMELYVRNHLRGATRFEWHGMECEIRASQFDVEKRDQLKQHRDEMRADGSDRRLA